MKRKLLFLIFGACSLLGFGQVKTKIITSFGAKGDGLTLNTTNIQAAINDVASAGGGRVIIPKGRFLSGGIILKSGVELHLEPGAVLVGSTDPALYPDVNGREALIMANNQSNISITGKGTIDGQGRRLALTIDSLFYAGKLDSIYYNLRRKRPEKRPKILEIDSCKKILISGITLKNSASWVQNYALCNNLVIDSIHVESDAYWNNDGIDITDCRNVRVTNCFVNSADDGICLKSEMKGFMNDSIYVADCTVRSSASAIKFGTASAGGFRNIKIERIKVYDTFRSAIAIESVDGGILENIEVDRIEATNTGNAIFIRLGHRNIDGEVGTLRNVTIKNVKVQVPFGPPDLNYEIRGPELAFFHNTFPSSITGIPGHKVENVVLENIEITMPGRGNDGMAIIPLYRLKDVPENESGYPEFSMFGELPAWGFYVRHVDGITFKSISVKAAEYDYRPAFVFDDVNDVKVNFVMISKTNNFSPIVLNNVSGSGIQNVLVPGLKDKTVRIIK
jgi:hypothetical protein